MCYNVNVSMSGYYLSIFVFVGLISISATHLLYAGGSDKTANYYRAKIEDYRGKKISLDVTSVRAVPSGPEVEKGLRMVAIVTYDDDNHTMGGVMIAICDKKQYDNLIRRYGTSVEQRGHGKGMETKSMRGVLRVYSPGEKHGHGEQSSGGKRGEQGGRNFMFLDLTGGGVDLSDAIAEHGNQCSGESGQVPGSRGHGQPKGKPGKPKSKPKGQRGF